MQITEEKIKEKIVKELYKTSKTAKNLSKIKRKAAKLYKTKFFSNTDLLKVYHRLVENKTLKKNSSLEKLLTIRKIRSLSGIVIISVLTKPFPCPGKCIFCPQQEGIPKSYLKDEPAVMRAIDNQFDPFKQVQSRIRMLTRMGHPTDKIDLRIIGATWSFYPKDYQTWFVKRCFQGANQLDKNKHKIQTLQQAQKENEKAKHRIIGITIETRPDYINKEEIRRLRKMGVTRVELGVQTIYNDILKLNRRGHTIDATIKATRLLKDAGFKICYQMMPNLLGSNMKRDEKMFAELFDNQNFRPDLLKIYPLALVKEAPLYKVWLEGKFKPYTKEQLITLLEKIKIKIPYYCRIQRIMRDIPANDIVTGGAKVSNLREIVQKDMKKKGLVCHCIRCREVKGNYDPKEKIYLFREDYEASNGKEIFLSFENKERTKLFSLLRLRKPSQCVLPVLKNASIIREVHTYGQLVPIAKQKIAPQHKGLGKKLMERAEEITQKEFKLPKIAVISGVGVRDYYRKLGYKLENKYGYMIKKLEPSS